MRSGGSGRVTEYEILRGGRVLAEAENLAAGVSARFSLTLQPGRYERLCPGGTRGEPGALVVTGTRSRAALAPALARGVRGYRRYLERQAGELMARTARFAAALRAGDAARARALFAVTRAPCERIEPVAESFGDLDPRIDARVNDVEPGRPWTGFHAIERRLWVKRTARGTTALARKLERDVARLARLVRTVRLEPAQIANGATALLGEVARSKITGRGGPLLPHRPVGLRRQRRGRPRRLRRDRTRAPRTRPGAPPRGAAALRAVGAALAAHRRGHGFALYTALSRDQVRRLARAIDALAEPLSRTPARGLGG